MRYLKSFMVLEAKAKVRALLLITCFGVVFIAASRPSGAQQVGGPTRLIITYRCPAANRPAFREAVELTETARFEKWKDAGVIQDYHLLFNWYADEDTWDMMAILSFQKYTDIARWHEIERTAPGGLSPASLWLGVPIKTYSADQAWHESTANTSGKSVFLVIPYDVANMEEYKSYAADYVIPQTKGWLREGILTSYNLYLNRYYAGRPWDALLVLEYRDLESLGQRESVIARVRATLSQDPKFEKSAWASCGSVAATAITPGYAAG